MEWLRGRDYDARTELNQLEVSVEAQRLVQTNWADLARWWALKPFLMSLVLHVTQQASGTNNILFYMTDIFQAAGSELPPLISSFIVCCVKVVMTLASVFLVDSSGRRPLLLGSCLLTAVGMAGLGTYFYLEDNGMDTSSVTWLPLASMATFIVGYSPGLGPLPWLIYSEIQPRKTKGSLSLISSFPKKIGQNK